jgi:hypothetical protein
MKIFYINNSGGGFANHLDVAEETTVAQLFAKNMPGCSPADYLIRVKPATADERLTEGCRVSITPVKIEGAIAA